MSFEIFYVKPWESADSGRAIVWKPFLWLPKRTGENYSLDIEKIEAFIAYDHTMMNTPVLVWSRKLSIIGPG